MIRTLTGCLIVVLQLPLCAQINIVAGDVGNGQLQISYTLTGGAPSPTAIGLSIELSEGATIGINDVLSVDPSFPVFIDYAHENTFNYLIGEGHPLALDVRGRDTFISNFDVFSEFGDPI